MTMKYIRSDGSFAEYLVVKSIIRKTREIVFYEVVGCSKETSPEIKLYVDGKEKYARLFIRRVFPII